MSEFRKQRRDFNGAKQHRWCPCATANGGNGKTIAIQGHNTSCVLSS